VELRELHQTNSSDAAPRNATADQRATPLRTSETTESCRERFKIWCLRSSKAGLETGVDKEPGICPPYNIGSDERVAGEIDIQQA